MIEAWDRGIEKISEACEETGAARFEIEYEPNGLWMIFHFSGSEKDDKTTVENDGKTRVKTTDAILDGIKKNPNISLADIAEQLGKAVSTVERAATKLQKEGKIIYKGPKRGGHWESLN